MAEEIKKTKLQRKLEHLKSHPEEAWQAGTRIIPQPCDDGNSKCEFCQSGCYKCATICSVSGLCPKKINKRFITRGYQVRYTIHVCERMLQRGITHYDVEEMIANNMVSERIHAEFVVDKWNKEIKIITVWPLKRK